MPIKVRLLNVSGKSFDVTALDGGECKPFNFTGDKVTKAN